MRGEHVSTEELVISRLIQRHIDAEIDQRSASLVRSSPERIAFEDAPRASRVTNDAGPVIASSRCGDMEDSR
jgi:hypothetical protein